MLTGLTYDDIVSELCDYLHGDHEVRCDLDDCINHGRFLILYTGGEPAGFLTWCEMDRNGKLFIWVNNLFTLKRSSLFFLRKFFRRKFPDMYRAYWWSEKRCRFAYVR